MSKSGASKEATTLEAEEWIVAGNILSRIIKKNGFANIAKIELAKELKECENI